jgi:predicted Zn finger-like uncharacterized protein
MGIVMADAASSHFTCPSCSARYRVVRVEAAPGLSDYEIHCVSCNAPIPARDGKMALKYFQIERSPRHRRAARSA